MTVSAHDTMACASHLMPAETVSASRHVRRTMNSAMRLMLSPLGSAARDMVRNGGGAYFFTSSGMKLNRLGSVISGVATLRVSWNVSVIAMLSLFSLLAVVVALGMPPANAPERCHLGIGEGRA